MKANILDINGKIIRELHESEIVDMELNREGIYVVKETPMEKRYVFERRNLKGIVDSQNIPDSFGRDII